MPGFHPAFGFGFSQEHRLGISTRKPSDALAEQLDLPKNQGLVIDHVMPNSPAAKAGLKPNDILLEFNGKQISSNPMDLTKAVQDVKNDKPVEAVVLRKGKRDTVKDISLPEMKTAAVPHPGGFQPFQGLPGAVPQPGISGIPGGGQFPQFGGGLGRGPMPNYGAFMPGGMRGPGMHEVMMTTIRAADHFTSRYQEGSLIITVTGNIADGKEKVGQIHVQDGRESKNYENVGAVPEQYRDKVQTVIDMSEPGKTRLEIKTPAGSSREKGK